MNEHRADAISELLATRVSRRRAIQGAGAAAGSGLLGLSRGSRPAAAQELPALLIGSCWQGGQALRFDFVEEGRATQFAGAFLGEGGGLVCAEGSAIVGPDGNIYITNFNPGRIDRLPDSQDSVLRYNGRTGEFIDEFVAPSRELDGPHGLAFGPDGNLYVSTRFTDSVLRYDAKEGRFLGHLVEPGHGGLRDAARLVFRDDGQVYVASYGTDSILRYEAESGRFVDEFVPAGLGGLTRPHDLVFGPDGHLYVSSWPANEVLRYDGQTGEFIDAFVKAGSGGLNYIGSMAFATELDANLLATSCINNMVLRFDGRNGEFMDEVVPSGAGGLNGTTFLLLLPAAQ